MLSNPSGASSRSRKDIAQHACETCRKRKSKCDEKRPRCTLCQRLNVDCHYKEADEAKKDESMSKVLEALQRIEMKLDTSNSRSGSQTQSSGVSPYVNSQQSSPAQVPGSQFQSANPTQEGLSEALIRHTRPNLTIPHKIILWPAIYSRLIFVRPQVKPELQAMYEGGTPWLIKLEVERQSRALPFQKGLPYVLASNVAPGEPSFHLRVSFPSLVVEEIERFTDAYFETFNVLYPILDYELFKTEMLEPTIKNGFGYGDAASVMVLLVLALGGMAVADIRGIEVGTPSSTMQNNVGFLLFNEARARVGSISYRCDLVNVQIQLLLATYYEASACHVEFWRCTVSASMCCQVLAMSPGVDWNTLQGDAVKRAYWTCVINEDLYHLDLDLARTPVHELEDTIPLPHFDRTQRRSTPAASESNSTETLLQYYFIAKQSLKRIISRIHEGLYRHSNQSESLDDYRSPPVHIVRELSRQLESWRSLLPAPLQWSGEQILATFKDEAQILDPALTLQDLDAGAATQVGRRVLEAELRSRFYFARYILYRPFVFKAIHFPQLMNSQDEEYCALAMRATCLWPVIMAPAKTTKRLIPHLFTWTQNFIGILLILWVSQHNDCLHRICVERLDGSVIETSITLMLQWIADVSQMDGIAEWSLRLLEPLFPPVVP